MANVSHRRAIKAIGGAALTTGLTLTGAAAQERTTTPPTATAFGGARATPAAAADAPPSTYLFFNKEEAAFIEPAVARLIPADEKWGGALEAGVPNYMDKQLVWCMGRGRTVVPQRSMAARHAKPGRLMGASSPQLSSYMRVEAL
jgi:gluconate 2-dehydrogenase gamma chain